MDPTAGLGLRDPLDPVHATLVLHQAVDVVAGEGERHGLHSTEIGGGVFEDLRFPALLFREMQIDPAHLSGEKSGFVAAGGGLHFHDDVLGIVGVGWQKRDLDGLLQFGRPDLQRLHLLLNQFPHLGVLLRRQHLVAVPDAFQGVDPLVEGVEEVLQFPMFPGHPAGAGGIGIDPRIGKFLFQFLAAGAQFIDIFLNIRRDHGSPHRLAKQLTANPLYSKKACRKRQARTSGQ